MKVKKILLGLVAAGALALASCDKNNNNPNPVKDRGTVDNTIPDVEIPDVFKKATSYTVIHQLENANGTYDTVEIESISSDADVNTYARPKGYEGYENLTYHQEKVKADGSTTITIKYKLVEHTINLDTEAVGGSVSGGGAYNINTPRPTLEAKAKIGYEFKGWYKGDKLMSTSAIYTPAEDDDDNAYHAEFEIRDDFKCFEFVSDFDTCTILGLVDYNVKLLVIPEGVTSIASYAFSDASCITVKLPSTLENIGQYAFYNCPKLVSMEFNSAPQIGYNVIPYSVVEIINLSGVPFENIYPDIQYYYGVNQITDAKNTTVAVDNEGFVFAQIESKIYLLGYAGADTKIELPVHPMNIEEIDSYAIYSYAFQDDDIESIVIPETVSEINYCAFENCTNLVEVYNFSENINLTENSDNYSYGYLGQYAKKITNDKSAASIVHSTADYDYVITGDEEKYATIIKYKKADKENVVINQIENYPTIIGSYLFKNSTDIKTLTLEEGVVGIEKEAFYDCPYLKEVNLGKCEGILENAFYSCKSLYQIELPSTLEFIGNYAFDGCYIYEVINLSNLEFEAATSEITGLAYHASNIVTSKAQSILTKTEDGFVYATVDDNKYLVKYVGSAKEIEVSSDYYAINPFAFAYCDATKLVIASEVELSLSMFYRMENLEYLVIPAETGNSGMYLYSYFDENYYWTPGKLRSLFINSKIEEFTNYYFSSINSITTLGLPNTLESCYDWMFDNVRINTIYFDGTIDEFYSINFGTNYKITSNADLSIYELKEDGNVSVNGKKYSLFEEYRIPDGVTVVGGDLSIPTVVKRVIIPEGVTEISASAFLNCSNLREVVIPSTLKTIGESAFSGCTQLVNIVLPEGLETIGDSAFYNTALSSIEVPSTVTTIGSYAFSASKIMIAVINSDVAAVADGTFQNCKNLQIVNYKENITTIGRSAFDGCQLLAKLKITEDLETIGAYAFDGSGIVSVDLSNTKVTAIENYTFSNTKRLQSVKVNENLASIGKYAFNASSIQSLDLSATAITTIAEATFSGCSKLKDIKLPATITTIEASAFAGCDKVESTEYGNGVYVGDEANPYKFLIKAKNDEITTFEMHKDCEAQGTYLFRYCKNLKKVVVPKEVAHVDQLLAGNTSVEDLELPYAGDGGTHHNLAYIFGYSKSEDLKKQTQLKKLKITAATTIHGYALEYCKATTIELPEELESIGQYAFRNCSFKEITIPSSVTSIATYAFTGCALESIDLSDLTNTEFSIYVFHNCFSLQGDSIILPTNMTEIPDGMFYGCSGITEFDFTGITKIGVKAFSASGLTSVTIPSTVTYVGNNAFSSCQNLIDATFECENPTLNYSIFYNCQKLETVVLPSKIAVIPNSMFQSCKALDSVTVPNTVTQVGEYAFTYTQINIFDFSNIIILGRNAFDSTKLTSVTLTKKTTDMGIEVFQNCKEIVEANINCEKLANKAFYQCSKLQKVVLGSNNKTIGNYAFFYCTALTDLTLSPNTQNIYGYAFNHCGFTSFVFPSYRSNGYDTFSYIDMYAFQGCPLRIIYVKGDKDAFERGKTNGGFVNTYNSNSEFYARATYFYSETEPTDSDDTYWHYDDEGNIVVWPKPTE